MLALHVVVLVKLGGAEEVYKLVPVDTVTSLE